MKITSNSAIVAEWNGDGRWRVIGSGIAEYLIAGPKPTDSLLGFAQALADHNGGPLVRCVLFIVPATNSQNGVDNLTAYPRTVRSVTSTFAMAHLADPSWDKFIIRDELSEVSAVFWREKHDGREQRLVVESLTELSSAARYLGIDKILTCRDEHAAIEGALRYADKLMTQPGVWRPHPEVRRMQAVRNISYDVLTTVLPVFHPSERALADITARNEVLLVVDANVDRFYGAAIRNYSQKINVVASVVTPAGEGGKSWREVERVLNSAIQHSLNRDGFIIGVGGGAVLDTAGLAASLFRRGVRYIRIPTTLVGLVDVAVGVKQGVNSGGRKNVIGSFYPPYACLNDYRFLSTCPLWTVMCGLAEIAKIATVRDAALFSLLEEHGPELVSSRFQRPANAAAVIAHRAELLMLEELAPNLFETDRARLVDFGHAFSPVIETASSYRIPHGEAVALDMLISAAVGEQQRVCAPEVFDRMAELMMRLGLPVWTDEMPSCPNLEDALEATRRHHAGALNLVVPEEIGRARFIQEVSTNQIEHALSRMYRLHRTKTVVPRMRVKGLYAGAGV